MADQEMEDEIKEAQMEARRQIAAELEEEINKNCDAISEAEKNLKDISPEFFDGFREPVKYDPDILFPDGKYNFFEYSRPLITEAVKKQFTTNVERFKYFKTCRLEFGRTIIRKPESGLLIRLNYNIYCHAMIDYLKKHDCSNPQLMAQSSC